MIRMLLLAVVAQLLLAAAVSADGPPPPPPWGMKYVNPNVRFAGLDKHSDYVFFLWYRNIRPDMKSDLPFRIEDAKTGSLYWSNQISPILLAMKRQDFEQRAKDAPKLDWLTDKTDGVRSVGLPRPATTVPEAMQEVPVATYHISIQDGELSVELVNDPRATPLAALMPPAALLPLWVVGLVASVAIAWLGIWFARRRFATPQPKELP